MPIYAFSRNLLDAIDLWIYWHNHYIFFFKGHQMVYFDLCAAFSSHYFDLFKKKEMIH